MKRILFIDGTTGFTPTRINEKPCGGIISSLTIIPKYLATQGYDVYVASMHEKEEKVNGVTYTQQKVEDVDIVVCNRNLINNHVFDMFKDAKKVWWLHDIVDPRYLEDDGYKRADKIVALSEYNVESYQDFYDIEPNKFRIIQNGVDTNVFYDDDTPRDENLFVCAAAPIKGMLPLEFTLHNLMRSYPDTDMRIYSNQKLHDLDNSAVHNKKLEVLKGMGANVLDPIPQKELADVLRKASALLMPNSYPEICSNLMLQSLACGCPVITSPIGSAEEFVIEGWNGMVTGTYPHDIHWWIKEYADRVITLREDEELRNRLSHNAAQDVVSWDEICEEWKTLMEEL